MKFNTLPYPVQLFLLTVLIAGITRIGLLFSFVDAEISQVWSPAGVTILVLFFAGVKFFPAVLVGTAVNYLLILPSVPGAAGISIGSTIEAVIGCWVLKRMQFDPSLRTLSGIGTLVVISGGVSTAVNALFSVTWYSVFIPSVAQDVSLTLLLWWMGNLVGVIVLSPIICLMQSRREPLWGGRQLLEFSVLIIIVVMISYNVFHANYFPAQLNYSLAFILFPFVIVASIRYGMIGSVIMTFAVSVNATLSTQTGLGLFAAEDYSTGIILVDIFLLVLGTTALSLASLHEERSTAAHSIRLSEERYRLVTERTGQLVYDYNMETGAIDWSGAVEEITQHDPDEFQKKGFTDWLGSIHPEDRAAAKQDLLDAMRLHREYRKEYRFRRKDGTYVEVLDRGAFLYRHASDIVAYRMLGTMADVSAYNITMRQLRESEERYKLFSLLTSDYIYSATVTGAGITTDWASDAFQRITGYTIDEMNEPDAWQKVIHPDDLERTETAWNAAMQSKPAVAEYRVMTRNGDVRWLRDYVKPIEHDEHGAVKKVMGGVQDITDRKQVEERFRILIERIADGIILLDKRGFITFVSSSATHIIGYAPDELLGTSIFSILHPSEAKKYAFKFGRLTVEFDRSESLFGRFKHKNGEWVYIEGMVTNLFNNPSVNAFVANFRNVTERILSEDRQRTSLQEKEILLKEVHHRVKNNMQVISSLLNLQSASVKDQQTVSVLRESQNRVKSMSLVHEILYQSQDLASVNFAAYVKQLVASLQKSFGAKSGGISIVVKVGTVALQIDDAIPCGLIINELVSNALKYAFPKQRSGEIIVEVKKLRSPAIRLTIRDNGVGLKKTRTSTDSLGLKLVQALTEQLKGTITIENKRGTAITIEFPYQQTTEA
jgi:PAS domain S-box-containing protein